MRLLPSFGAIWLFVGLCDLGARAFIVYAPPLQKVFYAPIVLFIWSGLALVPFILLRNLTVFRIYVTLFLVCLAFMAYDYFVPFRYVSPDFHGRILDSGGGYSSSGNNDSIAYWISYPTLHGVKDWPLNIYGFVTPLILAFVYRRFYPLWVVRNL
ncbi:MAG: hypothetical protein EOP84_09735 [Verrucomicrobiaceae bacterium]|nr:MAG: hypothetical protein EOP84_09735 [Verrucomicrobiaceae bacterium]